MFDVFLSHNGQDKPAVEALAGRLRSEAKLQPFLDTWHLVPGEPWQTDLEEALAESHSVAIFFGPHGLSPWHHEELRLALTRAVRTRDEYRVIPVLLPGAHAEEVTGFLSQRTWVDFRGGLEDAVAFRRLVAGIQGHAPEHDTWQLPDEPAPYRGLLPFGKAHARFFFGREHEIQMVLDKLGQHPCVAVVGASGVGKSSLVLSGVLPRLERPGAGLGSPLHLRTMRPGDRPLRALADQLATLVPLEARLATSGRLVHELRSTEEGFRTAVATLTAGQPGPFVLVVDQLEELFTYGNAGTPSEETDAFLANLRDAVERGRGALRLLVTLRADFFERCLELPALRELLQDHQVLLGPMGDEALRDAITRPAQVVGAFLETGLVSTILKDVSREPGALPLLEHALYELWRARNGAWLTLSAYEASGGVAGALQRRAQSTYEALRPEERELARKLFLRLTALGEGTPDTGRRIARGELVFPGTAPGQVEQVLRVLSGPEARLLVADEKAVQVAHEVLIQQWDTLRGWVNTNRRELQVHQRLTEATNGWTAHGRDASYLYTGSRLLEAEELFARELTSPEPGSLNQREHDFLAASLEHRDEQKRAEEQRHQAELERERQLTRAESERARSARRAAWRLRVLALVLLLATAGILALLGVARHQQQLAVSQREEAVSQRQLADSQREEAVSQQQLALSRELTANAMSNLQRDPQLSLLLIQEAGRIAMTDQVVEALLAWRLAPGWWVLRGREGHVRSASISPDGTRFFTVGFDGRVRLWDVATGKSTALSGHQEEALSASFSPDGTQVVTSGKDGTARLWDVATGKTLHVLSGHASWVTSASFSPDGTRVLTASPDGTARLWEAATGKALHVLSGHASWVMSASFSPDGTRVVTASKEGTARLWDAATGKALHVFSGHGPWEMADFSPDGTRLFTVGPYAQARLWDVATGKVLHVLGDTHGVHSASFSPDGTRLVTAGTEDTARLWDVATGKPTTVLYGHAAFVESVSFSPDGTRVITAGWDGTVRLWEAATGKLTAVLYGHEGHVRSASFSPDGTRAITVGDTDGTARLWNLTPDKLTTVLSGHAGGVKSASFSPDGTRVVTASYDGTARLWDVATGKPTTVLSGHEGGVNFASFSPDGTQVVTAGDDGTARLWDVATGKALHVLSGHEGEVLSASISPDGTRVVTVELGGTARLWDVATGKSTVLTMHGRRVESTSLSPDGTRVVTAGEDDTARLWDVATGKLLQALSGHEGRVTFASFSPDGTQLFTAGKDDTPRLWDVATGKLLHVLSRHEAYEADVRFASFSPDGTRVLTVSADGVYIWDVATGQALQSLSRSGGMVKSASFSPDGTRVVTMGVGAGLDATVRVWDVATGENLAILFGHKGPVESASFSPDGTRILTVDRDGTARLWPELLWAPIQDQLARLDAGRSLTPEECERYLHAPCPSSVPRSGRLGRK